MVLVEAAERDEPGSASSTRRPFGTVTSVSAAGEFPTAFLFPLSRDPGDCDKLKSNVFSGKGCVVMGVSTCMCETDVLSFPVSSAVTFE